MTTAFRPFDPFQVFTDQYGKLNAGGQLVFYVMGTTTPKDVYSDPTLTASLGNSVQIGTDGRPVSDIWGSDAYRVRMLDVNGVQIGPDRDNIAIPGGGAAALPTPFIPNALLSNDGSLPLWLETILMPDPTGHANNVLGTDGTAVFWQTLASLGIPTLTAGGTGVVLNGAVRIQWGSAVLPASGADVSTVAVGFATAFSGVPYWVGVTTKDSSGITTKGCIPILAATSWASNGFTLTCDINAASGDPPISRATNVGWLAIGPA